MKFTVIRYMYLLMSVLMVYFMYVQYNDPDPLRWMLLYGYCGLLMLLGYFNIKNKYLIGIGYIVFGLSFALLIPSILDWITIEKAQNLMQRMDDSKMYIEETREGLGSLICLILISTLHFKTNAF